MRKPIARLVLIALIMSSCNHSNNILIKYKTHGNIIEDGLYVVGIDRNTKIDFDNGVVTVCFNKDHIAYVPNFDVFATSHHDVFVSSDEKHAAPFAIKGMSVLPEEQRYWPLHSQQDSIWIYIGTDKGLKKCQSLGVHRLGPFSANLSP